MSNSAIRVEHLSKLYPSTPLRAGRIGKFQQRHDTASILRRCSGQAVLSAGLRDAISDFRQRAPHFWALQIADLMHPNRKSQIANLKTSGPCATSLSRACPEPGRMVQRGEVVGIPSTWLRTGIGRNGAGKSTLTSTRLRARLKILSRITEPTGGRSICAPSEFAVCLLTPKR